MELKSKDQKSFVTMETIIQLPLPLFASSCAYALDLCVTEVQNDRAKKRRTEARNEGLGSGLLNI